MNLKIRNQMKREILPMNPRKNWNYITLEWILIVTLLTVVNNLVVSSYCRMIITGMAFVYKNSNGLERENKKMKVYIVEEPVFYASKKKLEVLLIFQD